MIRAFENEKRIATAVILKDGSILQVYPSKVKHENEEIWKSTIVRFGSDGSEVTFKKEERPAPQSRQAQLLSRAEKAARRRVAIHLSHHTITDTPMQALVRKVYNQEGIRDSIRSTATDARNVHYGMRVDPGLYVMTPENGAILPVHFNRKSGMVFFGWKDETEGATDGLKFYRKNGRNELHPVCFLADEQGAQQKAVVVYNINRYNATIAIQKLRDAGFFIYTYTYPWRPTSSEIKEIYRVVPRCQGIVWDCWNEKLSYFDLASTDSWRCQTTHIQKWIDEHK